MRDGWTVWEGRCLELGSGTGVIWRGWRIREEQNQSHNFIVQRNLNCAKNAIFLRFCIMQENTKKICSLHTPPCIWPFGHVAPLPPPGHTRYAGTHSHPWDRIHCRVAWVSVCLLQCVYSKITATHWPPTLLYALSWGPAPCGWYVHKST